jgi:tRNA wybutosine-synthesizing protein 1
VPEAQISPEAAQKFSRAGYKIVGTHSAVKICYWTRKSLRENKVCYKEKWFGIESHRCLQMTPSLTWCTQCCEFCWRPLEFTVNGEPNSDDPDKIIDESISVRKRLATGFGRLEGIDKRKWKEAMTPTSVAISLAGEPLLYPRIGELIDEFHHRNMTSFLVTNGTRPDRIRSLTREPTNLYVSISAPNEDLYIKIARPRIVDGWDKLQLSLELMKSLSCRTVLRLTLVNGLNFKSVEDYASLVLKSNPDFVEAKSYSWLGESRNRLPRDSVIEMDDLTAFAKALAAHTNYKLSGVDSASRVVLLSK